MDIIGTGRDLSVRGVDLGLFGMGTGRDLSVRFDKLEYFVIFDLLKPLK